MTTLLLVRHGETDAVGEVLTGWTPGVHLNSKGRRQAESLAAEFTEIHIDAVYSSPLERTVETAQFIAAPHGLTAEILPELGECRFGSWEGRRFVELDLDERWNRFNVAKSSVVPPEGESMIAVQARMVQCIDHVRRQNQDGTVTIVSHADPLRLLLAYYLGAPIDMLPRFEIGTGSVSVVRFSRDLPQILCMNYTREIAL